jgi:hypothetical protein
MQSTPGWIAVRSDQAWHSFSGAWSSEILLKRGRLRQALLDFKKSQQLNEEILEPAKTETEIQGTYGQLPEVYVDQEYGAVFPMPVSKPNRFSWYQTAALAWEIMGQLDQIERHLSTYTVSGHSKEEGKKHFEQLLSEWNAMNSQVIVLAHTIRYLSTWPPLLEAQQKEFLLQGQTPPNETLARGLFEGDPKHLEALRLLLRPRRIVRQNFLPAKLSEVPAGVISVPVSTDIRDRKFLKEFEGALMTHWNQSSWAKNTAISFHIHWKFLKPNPKFAAKKETLPEHLSHFPQDTAIITTGGFTTHVRGSALVLGPGKVTPRTLAHEFGHLLGFNDCYLRTLTGQGVFGLAVLEWDNPFYPDDIMCDNNYGEPRVEVW